MLNTALRAITLLNTILQNNLECRDSKYVQAGYNIIIITTIIIIIIIMSLLLAENPV